MIEQTAQNVVIKWIGDHIEKADGRPPLLFISGAQGAGKSTALNAAQQHFGPHLAVLGLDEFYLTQAERQKLAATVHPLFATRGPPGTHDLRLLNEAIDRLLLATDDSRTSLPMFSKANDDRLPTQETFSGRPLAIVVEGWLVGAIADPAAPDSARINRIEEKDPDGTWRRFQENHLAEDYAALWDRADDYLHIVAPNFDTVLGWRSQQEETNLGLAAGTLPADRKAWVEEFILHYERITRRMLSGQRRNGSAVHVREDRSVQMVDEHASAAPPFIVVSDLDGTLLDHDTYAFDDALPALSKLAENNIPVVLASSKTGAEMVEIRAAMKLEAYPAIVENGAGFLPPSAYAMDERDAETDYTRLIKVVDGLPPNLRNLYTGFNDMGPEKIAQVTGLAPEDALRAATRIYSEPGVFSGTEDELMAFTKALAADGVTAVRGGRFLTLSFGGTKAKAINYLKEIWRHRGQTPKVVALGDAANDIGMIDAADIGVIVANPHGLGIPQRPRESTGQIRRTQAAGPTGWNAAILDILNEFGISS